MNKKLVAILSILSIVLFGSLFAIMLVFPSYSPIGGTYDYPVTIFASFLLLVWGIAMTNRVQIVKPKRILMLIVITSFLWMVLKFAKWLSSVPDFIKYLDYAYYIPIMLIPTLFFFLCIETFYPDSRYKKVFFISPIIINTFFIVMAFTNDLHGLIYHNYHFNITGTGDLIYQEIIYTYGIVHDIAMMYIGLLIIISIIIIIYQARLSLLKAIVPSIIVILAVTYSFLYAYRVPIVRSTLFLEDLAFMAIVFLQSSMEAILDVGVIQNNGRYDWNFSHSMLPMCIYDANNKKLFKSKKYNEQAYLNPSQDIRNSERIVGLYTIVSQANLSEIIALRQTISEETNELENANRLLTKMLEITAQQASIEYRLELTEEIEQSIGETRQTLYALVSSLPNAINDENASNVRKTLGRIALSLGFMKQNCMLLLGAKEKKSLSSDAFYMLLNVIAHDIKSVGFGEVAITVSSKDEVDFSFANNVNEFANAVANAYEFLTLNALFIVNPNERTIIVELDGKNIKAKHLDVENMNITTTYVDNGLRISACEEVVNE